MILSITIPTYNRLPFLKVMLASVISQIEEYGLSVEVEIVVADNASTDGTGEYLNELTRSKPDLAIRYYTNETNIGLVKNLTNLVHHAKGEYWMFYGDDDLMYQGALPAVVDALKKDGDKPVFVFKQKNSPLVEKDEDLSIHECAERFFYYMGNACSAARTSFLLESLDHDYEAIVSTCWPQTHLYFLGMYKAGLDKPAAVRRIEVYDEQPKDHNNIPNAFYLFDSQFYGLFRTGYQIAVAAKNPRFLKAFKKGIPFVRFPYYWGFVLLVMTSFKVLDSPQEREDFKRTLAESYKVLSPADRRYLIPFSLLKYLPATVFLPMISIFRAMRKSLGQRSLRGVITGYKDEKRQLIEQKRERFEKMKLKHAITIGRGGW